VRQGVGIGLDAVVQDGRRAAENLGHGYIEDENRYLKDIQPDNFFDQIALGYDDIEPGHHQYDDDPIIDKAGKCHA
jgi:hypothetical protein